MGDVSPPCTVTGTNTGKLAVEVSGFLLQSKNQHTGLVGGFKVAVIVGDLHHPPVTFIRKSLHLAVNLSGGEV